MPRLLCFGLGYSARALAATLDGWQVTGTSRDGQGGTVRFDRDRILPPYFFAGVTHLLVSIPPDEEGDPAFDRHRDDIAALTNLQWLGYLSTTGVYGNRDGRWVNEGSELRPTGPRGERRCDAEEQWLSLGAHVFRLAGIYGPGRSAFDTLRAGTARRFDRPGQVFSRIHVDDLVAVLRASMARPRHGAIYNVCDDEPAAPADVVAYAAGLLGVAPPPLEPFDPAALSPMARSFWADNKRVSNALIKRELGVVLRHPDYRAGLAAILAAGG
jgi:nucleoside-diphosphate-sugar epimerase